MPGTTATPHTMHVPPTPRQRRRRHMHAAVYLYDQIFRDLIAMVAGELSEFFGEPPPIV
jgi:hypothetical protein